MGAHCHPLVGVLNKAADARTAFCQGGNYHAGELTRSADARIVELSFDIDGLPLRVLSIDYRSALVTHVTE
jgi:hypothetical protein